MEIPEKDQKGGWKTRAKEFSGGRVVLARGILQSTVTNLTLRVTLDQLPFIYREVPGSLTDLKL